MHKVLKIPGESVFQAKGTKRAEVCWKEYIKKLLCFLACPIRSLNYVKRHPQ